MVYDVCDSQTLSQLKRSSVFFSSDIPDNLYFDRTFFFIQGNRIEQYYRWIRCPGTVRGGILPFRPYDPAFCAKVKMLSFAKPEPSAGQSPASIIAQYPHTFIEQFQDNTRRLNLYYSLKAWFPNLTIIAVPRTTSHWGNYHFRRAINEKNYFRANGKGTWDIIPESELGRAAHAVRLATEGPSPAPLPLPFIAEPLRSVFELKQAYVASLKQPTAQLASMPAAIKRRSRAHQRKYGRPRNMSHEERKLQLKRLLVSRIRTWLRNAAARVVSRMGNGGPGLPMYDAFEEAVRDQLAGFPLMEDQGKVLQSLMEQIEVMVAAARAY